MTWQSEFRAWAVASAAVACLGSIGYKVVTMPTLPDLAPTVKRANDTLDIINRPCEGDSDSCGTVASVGKLVKKVGDIVVTTQMQVKQSSVIVNAAAQSLASTSQHLDAAIDTARDQLPHIGPLLDSAKGAVDSATTAIDSLPPAVRRITWDVNTITLDTDSFLNNYHLTHTFENVDSMTGSWAGVSVDFRKVADKTTADYLKPVKWYMYPLKRGGEVMDIGAAAARHLP